MVRSFDYKREFAGKSSSNVRQSILSWLKLEESKVTSDDGHHHIEAIHGKGWILAWERNAKKILDIRIEETPGKVLVTVRSTPSKVYFDDVPHYEAEISESCSKLFDELWATVEGGEMAIRVLKPLAMLEHEAIQKRRSSIRTMTIGLAVMGAGTLLILGFLYVFGPQNNPAGSIVGSIIGLAVGVGGIIALLGIFTYASSRNDLRRIKNRESGGQI